MLCFLILFIFLNLQTRNLARFLLPPRDSLTSAFFSVCR